MRKYFVLITFLLVSISVYAQLVTHTFKGSAEGASDGELIVLKVEGKNIFTYIKDKNYSLEVNGPPGARVDFYLRNKRVHKTILQYSGDTTVDLDVNAPELPQEKVVETKLSEQKKEIPLQADDEQIQEVTKKQFLTKKNILMGLLFLVIIVCIVLFLVFKKSRLKGPNIKFKEAEEDVLGKRDVSEYSEADLTPQEKQMISYINDMLGKGFSEQQIKAALFARGWKGEDIEGAFSKI